MQIPTHGKDIRNHSCDHNNRIPNFHPIPLRLADIAIERNMQPQQIESSVVLGLAKS